MNCLICVPLVVWDQIAIYIFIHHKGLQDKYETMTFVAVYYAAHFAIVK